MKSQYEVILGDTKNVLKEMIESNEKVDMIFTSPPYYSMRKNYSGNNDGEVGSIHVDDYADWFLEFTDLFLKVLKPNGSFFLNINDKIDDGVIHPVLDELKYKMRWLRNHIYGLKRTQSQQTVNIGRLIDMSMFSISPTLINLNLGQIIVELNIQKLLKKDFLNQ
jgi:DNA modification methylase